MRLFERWLDEALAAEERPDGIDAELLAALDDDAFEPGEEDSRRREADSYAVWAALTALTQEVKLQGRAFKELHGALSADAARQPAELRAVLLERDREIERESERECRREILGALIDLRDALGRGLESVRAAAADLPGPQAQSWLRRIVSPGDAGATSRTITALTTGYELVLARLDQVLEDFDVREVVCLGQPFDPRRMNAVDRETAEDLPGGTVLEVYRTGYEWNGDVFRTAHVKVSIGPQSTSSREGAEGDHE